MTQRLRFFVLSSRDPRLGDFRTPFVEALRQQYETYYIKLGRHSSMSGPVKIGMSLPQLLLFFWRLRRDDVLNVYFNSTDTSFPLLTGLLRLISPRGVWCFDMHDELRYDSTGLKRLHLSIALMIVRSVSDIILCSTPTLIELFPKGRHLGLASHVLPLPRNAERTNEVLVIASFDDRCDFSFLSKVAALCPETQFHLHGAVRSDRASTRQQLTATCNDHSNIHYHGAYTHADLPTLLQRYDVTLAPYRRDLPWVRYIDPERFYHCLNAGLEVISTDVPGARRMSRSLNIARDPSECAAILAALRSGNLAKRGEYSLITWEQRIKGLVEIIREHTKTGDKIAAPARNTVAEEA
jgi:glycosyltransferase involved in cell wall biosynthesis